VRVVVSQSMYFPWVGMLEQMQLADTYVRYDDVQYSKGSFTNRVQVKTASGIRWLTVPLSNLHLGQRIDEVEIGDKVDWRTSHREILADAYRDSDFFSDVATIVDDVFSAPAKTIADVSYASMVALADYFDIGSQLEKKSSIDLDVDGASSQRVLDIVLAVGGRTYITGHGARKYLDHELFERSGVSVEYMKYVCEAYPQKHGPFTPYVTALDLVANCGRDGKRFIQSGSVNWRAFLGPDLPGRVSSDPEAF
jgi:hypothetical protein